MEEYLSRTIVCSDCDRVKAEFTLAVGDKLVYLCEKCTKELLVRRLGQEYSNLSIDHLMAIYNQVMKDSF